MLDARCTTLWERNDVTFQQGASMYSKCCIAGGKSQDNFTIPLIMQ